MPNNTQEEIDYSRWLSQYYIYMRSTVEHRYTNIFIPTQTEMLVWYERWQLNDDMTDFQHMWNKGEKTFYIPDGIARYDIHTANKDVTVPMVLMSLRNESNIPDSRIITEIYGETWPVERDAHFGDVIYEPEPYGLWVKMYEEPTYIPALGTKIVAYGVYEENVPKVADCFKYGNMKHGVGNLTYKATTGIYQPITVNPNLPGQWNGTTTYPTVVTNNSAYDKWLQDNNINSISTTKGKSILDQYIQNIQNNPTMKWTCQICGMDTSYVEYDYLGSGTNHLQCELKSTMNNIFALEN